MSAKLENMLNQLKVLILCGLAVLATQAVNLKGELDILPATLGMLIIIAVSIAALKIKEALPLQIPAFPAVAAFDHPLEPGAGPDPGPDQADFRGPDRHRDPGHRRRFHRLQTGRHQKTQLENHFDSLCGVHRHVLRIGSCGGTHSETAGNYLMRA